MYKKLRYYKCTVVIVSGSGHFPTMMLKEDMCIPMANKDVVQVEHFTTGLRQVSLLRFSRSGAKASALKWKELGWEVVYDEGS